MSNLIPFSFEDNQVRVTVDEKGQLYFVAKDVCEVLEFDITNVKQILDTHLEEDEKGRFPVPTLGGVQELWCVNESGLYCLIIRSNKPKAKTFRKWVTSEVIPSALSNWKHESTKVINISSEQSTSTALAPITNPVEYLKVNAVQVRSNVREFKAIGKDLGLTGNQLTLQVVRIIKKAHNGLDLLQVFEQQQHLVEEVQQRHFSVSELGQRVGGLSAVKLNKLLEAQGFQFSTRDRKNNIVWVATEKGKPYCDLTVVTRSNSDGTSQQLRWYETILDVLVIPAIPAKQA